MSKVECTSRANGWMDAWAPGWIGFVHQNDTTTTIPSITYHEAATLAQFQRKVLLHGSFQWPLSRPQVLHHGAVYPALEKGIPIRVTNTLDITHPGTLIEPTRPHTRPRVCEITTLALAQYEAANKTKVPVSVTDTAVSIVALIGHQIRLIPGIDAKITSTIKQANPQAVFEIVHAAGPLADAQGIMVLVPSDAAASTAKALHSVFLGQKGVRRWLVPTRVPSTVSLTPASGAGWA